MVALDVYAEQEFHFNDVLPLNPHEALNPDRDPHRFRTSFRSE